MKFTDGMWLSLPGVQNYYAAQSYDVASTETTLTIYAPVTNITNRGDTLQGPVITIELSSPRAGVIKVKAWHFKGATERGPRFDVFNDHSFKPDISVNESYASITSGDVTARIPVKGAFTLEFLDQTGKVVSRSEPRGMGYSSSSDRSAHFFTQLTLDVGELVYGLGERFTALTKNGQSVETWNKDGGAGTDQAYKSIPFFMTDKGYGVFVNHPGNVEFEVCTERASRVQFSVPGEEIEYYFVYGSSPKEVLSRYTALTGRPALPPAWTFGLWLTTSFTTSYDEATVTSFLDGMSDRSMPLHVFHFDCFWMRGFHWTDFEWDAATFPNPREMLKRLHDRGLKVCVWINSYISQRTTLFEEGKAKGYLIKKENGDVWQTDQWQPGMAIVDFTNPDACKWYQGYLKRLLEEGVDCFKTDFGERIPHEGVKYFDGSDPEKMHNYYTNLYNKTVFDLLVQERGQGEAALFARSATAGGQQYPVHWGGDCWSNFNAMAESMRAGLSLCLSGFAFWSHDIGGFEGTPPASLYKRWLAFGLLSTHSRLHGSSSYRVPWLYDDEACDVLRFFTELKCELMPYLFAKAVEASKTGIPMMRAMLLEFPDDPAARTLDRQYLLGDSIMIAPIMHEDGHAEYYIPEGRWTKYITGEVISGPKWIHEYHGFLSSPILVRPGSMIAVGSNNQRPDYDFSDGVTIRIYELADGEKSTAEIPNIKGDTAMTVTASRTGKKIEISATGDTKNWSAQLVGIDGVASIDGATTADGSLGLLLKATSPKITAVLT